MQVQKTPETFNTLKMILKIKILECNLDVDIIVGITVKRMKKKGLELYDER